MKTLKFKKHLVDEVLSGRKNVTWRIFDEKEIRVGDKFELINGDTGEKFESEEEMYKTYRSYYGDRVNKDTLVKIIKFS